MPAFEVCLYLLHLLRLIKLAVTHAHGPSSLNITCSSLSSSFSSSAALLNCSSIPDLMIHLVTILSPLAVETVCV